MALVITTPPPAPVESPKKVMTSQLAKEGIAVSTAMCEHFAMSRADLSQAVQVAELEAFSHIIERFGVGSGCDICRPAVASILASLHNRHVLAEGRAALQDTNAELDSHMERHIATYEDEWWLCCATLCAFDSLRPSSMPPIPPIRPAPTCLSEDSVGRRRRLNVIQRPSSSRRTVWRCAHERGGNECGGGMPS